MNGTRRVRWSAIPAVAGVLAALLCAAPAAAFVGCTISASGVNLGIYDPLSSTAAVANGSVSVTCNLLNGGSASVPVTVSLSSGSSGNFALRNLMSGGSALGYNLFRNAAHTQVWGDGTAGSFVGTATLSLSPASPVQTLTSVIYGRVTAAQDVGAGAYSDTIVVTVSY